MSLFTLGARRTLGASGVASALSYLAGSRPQEEETMSRTKLTNASPSYQSTITLSPGLKLAHTSSLEVFCQESSPNSQFPMNFSQFSKPDWVNTETIQPLAGGLTFGGASGLAAGIACKKIGKAVAVGVGGVYCLFQVAASYGYITVNWKKVEKDVMAAIDTNGDGKVDEKDMGVWMTKALKVLSNEEMEGAAAKNAGAGGFAGGFVVGLRKG